jgi:hypothetical protein
VRAEVEKERPVDYIGNCLDRFGWIYAADDSNGLGIRELDLSSSLMMFPALNFRVQTPRLVLLFNPTNPPLPIPTPTLNPSLLGTPATHLSLKRRGSMSGALDGRDVESPDGQPGVEPSGGRGLDGRGGRPEEGTEGRAEHRVRSGVVTLCYAR